MNSSWSKHFWSKLLAETPALGPALNIFSVSYPHCWKSAPFVRHAVSAEVVPCGVFASADCVSNGSGLGTDSHVLGAPTSAPDRSAGFACVEVHANLPMWPSRHFLGRIGAVGRSLPHGTPSRDEHTFTQATHDAIDGTEKMKSQQKAPHATVEMVVDFTLDITKSGEQTDTEEPGGEAALAGQVSKTAAPRRLRFARHAGRLARHTLPAFQNVHAIRHEPVRNVHCEMDNYWAVPYCSWCECSRALRTPWPLLRTSRAAGDPVRSVRKGRFTPYGTREASAKWTRREFSGAMLVNFLGRG